MLDPNVHPPAHTLEGAILNARGSLPCDAYLAIPTLQRLPCNACQVPCNAYLVMLTSLAMLTLQPYNAYLGMSALYAYLAMLTLQCLVVMLTLQTLRCNAYLCSAYLAMYCGSRVCVEVSVHSLRPLSVRIALNLVYVRHRDLDSKQRDRLRQRLSILTTLKPKAEAKAKDKGCALNPFES